MGMPAAKEGDHVLATDIHVALSPSVNAMSLHRATVTSTAQNTPPDIPMPPGTAFVALPTKIALILQSHTTESTHGKPATRKRDTALTCDQNSELQGGEVVAVGTVFIGG